ncbi:MAG: hypothetical protein GC171_08490 [Terrimonas sp.]|nr:hypothetical protein [Terrimonas sp.]
MKKQTWIFKLLRGGAMTANMVFVLWILYNGIQEGFRGTVPEIISYIGLMLLLTLNTLLLSVQRGKPGGY